jgi:hypothetical protein
MRRLLLSCAAAGAVFAICVTNALAAGDVWTQWAPTPSDTLHSWIRSLDFTATGSVLASSDGGGVATGNNGGVFQAPTGVGPWSQAITGLTDISGAQSVYQVVASGTSMYAATSAGLFKATQGADPSWTQLGGGTGADKLNMGGIESVVVESPTDLVVAVAGAGDPGVYTSTDGGSLWNHASGMPPVQNIYELAQGAGPVIYAAGDSGVWTSVNGGSSWTLTSDGIDPAETAFRVAVAPGTPNQLWADAGEDVYESTDGGANWANVDGIGTTLPGAQAKLAFLLTPSIGGNFGANRAIVGTNDGVWATVDGGQNWGPMSISGVGTGGSIDFGNEIIWALGLAPTGADLLAGTQADGVFSLPLTPVTAPSTLTVSPSSSIVPGDNLNFTSGGWGGTLPLFYTYQWRKCSGSSCSNFSDIPGATGATFTVPNSDANTTTRYDVLICAINLVSPSHICAKSTSTTSPVGSIPGTAPEPLGGGGSDATFSPDPQTSYPWGTAFSITSNGDWEDHNNPGTKISPSGYHYRWQRCDDSGDCSIIPGATHATYTTTVADVGYGIEADIQGVYQGVSSDYYEITETYTVIQQTPVNVAAPKIVGLPYVGQTLQSSAGAWNGYDPTYTKRWLLCGADGLDCNPLSPDQTGDTITITSADLGSRLELAVTADQADPTTQDRIATANSAATAVITNAPGGPGGPGGGGGGPKPPTIHISGPKKLKAGSKLIGPAKVSGFTKISFQWLRNGNAIKHANGATYKLAKSDLGQRISLRVTVTTSGGAVLTATSNAIKVPKPKTKRRHHKRHHKRRRKR